LPYSKANLVKLTSELGDLRFDFCKFEVKYEEFLMLLKAVMQNSLAMYRGDVLPLMELVDQKLIPNLATRKAMSEVCSAMWLLITDTPVLADSAVAVDQWHAEVSSHSDPSGCVGRCVSYQQAWSQLPLLKFVFCDSDVVQSTRFPFSEIARGMLPELCVASLLNLPAQVHAARLSSTVGTFLAECTTHLADKFCDNLELDGVILVYSVFKDGADVGPLADMAGAVVDVEKLTESIASLASSLGVPGEAHFSLPCAKVFNMLRKLQINDTSESESLFQRVFDTGLLPRTAKGLEISTASLMSLMEVYVDVMHISSIIGYFKQVSATFGFAVQDHCLKPQVEDLVRTAEERCQALKSKLRDLPDAITSLSDVGWKLSVGMVTQWLEMVESAVVDSIKMACLSCLVADLVSLTSTVKEKTPSWEHVFPADNMYVRNLAKKDLLDHKHRHELSPLSVQLFRGTASLTKAAAAFRLDLTATEHDFTATPLAVARTVFTAAKKAVTIVAHCHVVQEMRGAEQKAAAKVLCDTEQDVPLMLKQELQSLCEQRPAAAAAAAAACKGAKKPAFSKKKG